jgi:putative endonuclease
MRKTESSARKKGNHGEDIATEYLRGLGFRIVTRNFRSRRGEVDIVAVKNGTIAFVEVKSWNAVGKDGLEHAIDRRKQGRIIETSRYFLARESWTEGYRVRYDVIFVGAADGQVELIADAFAEKS